MSRLLGAALGCAQQGWYVFPLQPRSKYPLPGSHGLNDATTDVDRIREWWRRFPSANIGVNCGPSRLAVLDVDPRHGGDATWGELLKLCGLELLDTRAHRTGSGGRHFLYCVPDGVTVGSRNGWRPGVDCKSTGGYILWPPSLNENGPYTVVEEREPAPVPPYLLELLPKPAGGDWETPSADGAIIGEHTRNDTLSEYTRKLKRIGLTEAEVVACLLVMNANRVVPPLDEREVRRIAHSNDGRYVIPRAGRDRPFDGRRVGRLARVEYIPRTGATRLAQMEKLP